LQEVPGRRDRLHLRGASTSWQIDDLGDLDAQVPNLTIYAARGSASTVTAYIRGIGQADPLWGVDPGVGIYLDDVYIAGPQGALLDVFDVSDAWKCCAAPQGTLYGKNTHRRRDQVHLARLPATTSGFGSITVGNYNQLDVKGAIGGSPGAATPCARGWRWPASPRRLRRQPLHAPGSERQGDPGRARPGRGLGQRRLRRAAGGDWMDDQVRRARRDDARAQSLHRSVPAIRAQPPMDDRYDIRAA
jgi:iron complex outermembrane receptor protein